MNKDAVLVPESKIAESQTVNTSAIGTDEGAAASETSDHLKMQAAESRIDALKSELPQLRSESPQLNRQIVLRKGQGSFLGNFEVVQDSFLRDKPESDAAITTLLPGTRVKVESKNGDYLYVSSLNDPGLRGYVHREDAFFERIR